MATIAAVPGFLVGMMLSIMLGWMEGGRELAALLSSGCALGVAVSAAYGAEIVFRQLSGSGRRYGASALSLLGVLGMIALFLGVVIH